MTDYTDHGPDSLVSPPATISTPNKPNDAQKKIANKMKNHAEKILNDNKKYVVYKVHCCLYNNDIYCFRVHVDNGVIVVCGEYAGGMVDKVNAKKVNDLVTESMKLNWDH